MTEVEAMAIVRRLAARLGMPLSAPRAATASPSIIAYATTGTEQVWVRRGDGISLQFDGLTTREAEALIEIWSACPTCGRTMPADDRRCRYQGERMHAACASKLVYSIHDDEDSA